MSYNINQNLNQNAAQIVDIDVNGGYENNYEEEVCVIQPKPVTLTRDIYYDYQLSTPVAVMDTCYPKKQTQTMVVTKRYGDWHGDVSGLGNHDAVIGYIPQVTAHVTGNANYGRNGNGYMNNHKVKKHHGNHY